jgi:hypothetical protein
MLIIRLVKQQQQQQQEKPSETKDTTKQFAFDLPHHGATDLHEVSLSILFHPGILHRLVRQWINGSNPVAPPWLNRKSCLEASRGIEEHNVMAAAKRLMEAVHTTVNRFVPSVVRNADASRIVEFSTGIHNAMRQLLIIDEREIPDSSSLAPRATT